ncbi:uncharacterized protein LOC104583173 [Brachypodium distachyon]|uniref:uncharacterized protein LOC104583173 n=1 Tax=Brachypodium distachyon TaxID=15368 RepID=UPI00052FE241|nr:uncharacterized protein LOC104583173 [Brachypodium distachyon]|eukprot:XP_010233243.1 uncharacterized protein LOC104583173 [Brachypodium distachyon]
MGDDRDDDLHDNNINDLAAYCLQEDMDRDLPFGRSYAADSDDNDPDEEVNEDGFTTKEAKVHDKVLGHDHRISLFRNVSLADEAVVDGDKGNSLGPRPISYRDMNEDEYVIQSGIRFRTLLEYKVWIKEYSVTSHHPYKVIHADTKLRYTVKCVEEGYPWIVRARPLKGGPEWHIYSCSATHLCTGKNRDDKDVKIDHLQLTSEFIGYKLSNSIKSLPTMSIKEVIELVDALFHYKVKYGKAWKAKQAAFNMLYGDWEEAYNRLPRLLGAMAHTNPGMIHMVEPFGQRTRIYNGANVRVFGLAFWAFEQCIRGFQHYRPVISVNGTFLTGQFKGTMLVAIANDANSRLFPLAFDLVSAESNDNWAWFIGLLRIKVIPQHMEVCVISDRHQGILNAMEVELPGFAPLHHRWCMRHFVANFYRACRNQELSDYLKHCCQAYSERRFSNLINALLTSRDLSPGVLEFLNRHLASRSKWARAFDEGGRRYGQMTSNMAECFNMVLRGVRALPVTAIVQYTFDKMNGYFLKYSEETDRQIAGKNRAKKKYMYPPKVDAWITFQTRKADSQTAVCFDNDEWIYQVNEPRGTTSDGVQHGGRAFEFSLRTCECSCKRPSLQVNP